MSFPNPVQDLGIVRVGQRQYIKFPYEDVLTIDRATASCDCTNVEARPIESVIYVEYMPQAVPIHLKQRGDSTYRVAKTINIVYTAKEAPGVPKEAALIFTAIVTE